MKRYVLFGLVCSAALVMAGCSSSSSSNNSEPWIVPLTLDGNTTTLAGDGTQAFQDSTDGTGATAQFNFPRGIATDGTALYLSESTGRRIRKIDSTTGETVNLAGNGNAVYQDSTDGTGATASFAEPRQLTYKNGYLYLCDNGSHTIRKISVTTGETTTLAGNALPAYQDSTDGTGATAQFANPAGIDNDGTYLYVADSNNNYIRKVNMSSGETTTLAGNGIAVDQESTDGTGSTAGFNYPLQVSVEGNYVYVANIARIFKINKLTGETTFFAGTSMAGYQDSTDGTGATALFATILGLYSDGTALYVGDAGNNRIRRVDLNTGDTTTIAGDGTPAFQDSTDGTGATAQFSSPRASVSIGETLFIADGGNHRVRKIK